MSPIASLVFVSNEHLRPTRDGLHSIAEWLMAGPQYARAGTIRLLIVPSGIATKDGLMRLTATELISSARGDERRAPLKGSLREMGQALGTEPAIPEDLYSDHSPLGPTDELRIDSELAGSLLSWFERGATALRAFAPHEEPILWPEHFDVGFEHDEVNYGISLGDADYASPYAYVSPWQRRAGDFWNAPFGAVKSVTALPDDAAIRGFFEAGALRATADPVI